MPKLRNTPQKCFAALTGGSLVWDDAVITYL